MNFKGSILLTTIIMTGLFAATAVGLASLVNYQHKLARQKISWSNAMSIAEAGIDYYRWHLAHDPTDYQDGTGQEGPYLHDYTDPYGSVVGKYKLDITAPSACSNTITIKSTAWTLDSPQTTRTAQIKYGKKSLADYAFITNSDAWFGDNEELHGPIHSNGGIRQDGLNDAQVTSAKETYTCGSIHGCSSSGETKPGVWGSGSDQNLWLYPTSNVDFDSLTVNLSELKTTAQSKGLFFGNLGLGYHVIFKTDGTMDIYRVTRLKNKIYYWDGGGYKRKSWDIDRESFYGNYEIPSECAIIFIEDNVWVEGTVNGRVTLVAAKLPDVPNNRRKIIINGDITYLSQNGDDVLGLIAQDDIIVPYYAAENNLEINAAMISQFGHITRYYYWTGSYRVLDTITVYGSIITNQIWTWSWVNGSGTTISGYRNTNTIYDPHLTYNPPPSFPTVDEFSVLQWEEITEKE